MGKTPGQKACFIRSIGANSCPGQDTRDYIRVCRAKSRSLTALVKESAVNFSGFQTLSVMSTTRIQTIPKLFFVLVFYLFWFWLLVLFFFFGRVFLFVSVLFCFPRCIPTIKKSFPRLKMLSKNACSQFSVFFGQILFGLWLNFDLSASSWWFSTCNSAWSWFSSSDASCSCRTTLYWEPDEGGC